MINDLVTCMTHNNSNNHICSYLLSYLCCYTCSNVFVTITIQRHLIATSRGSSYLVYSGDKKCSVMLELYSYVLPLLSLLLVGGAFA